jgi:O-antigen/teichoic acid export membrane protein
MSRLRATLHGAAWGGAAKLVHGGAALLALALIARAVGPQAWGLYALAWVLAGLIEIVVFSVPVEAIAQRRILRSGHLSAVFVACVAFALIAWGAAFALAAPISALLGGGAALAALLPWRLATVPIVAATAVPAALLTRRAHFTRIAAIDAVGGLAGSAAGIAGALGGLGLWSLVVMEAVRVAVWSAGTFAAAGWRPGRPGRLAHLAELARFSSRAWLAWAVAHLDQQLPRLAIGAALGPQALGLYALAERLLLLLNQVLVGPAYQSVTVAAARLRQDPAAVRALYAGTLGAVATVALPVYLGAAAVAPLAVPMLLGEAWAPAAACVAVTMLMGVRAVSTALDVAVIRGLGQVGWHLALVCAGTAITLVAMPAVAHLGPEVVAAALVGRSLLLGPALGAMLTRLVGLGATAQAACWSGPLAAAGTMAVTVAPALPALRALLGDLGALAAAIAAGALLYGAALRVFAPGHFGRAAALVLPRLGRASATARGAGTAG